MPRPAPKMKYKVKTTAKQKQAVDNVLGGKFKNLNSALQDAGYSKSSSMSAQRNVFMRRGVEVYLAQLDKKAQRRFGLNLKEKVMETYLDGLDATKWVRKGKRSIEHPDFLARKQFADKFSEFFQWSSDAPPQKEGQQYNFFMFSEKEQGEFNDKFKDFLKGLRK